MTAGGSAIPANDIRVAWQFPTDTGVVTVEGGSVTCRYFQLANKGNGTLTITSGRVRANGSGAGVRLGNSAGGVSTLNISGDGVLESANDFAAGFVSDTVSYLNISGGTLKNIAGSCYWAQAQNTTCTVVQTGGLMDLPNGLILNNDASGTGYVEYHLGGGTNRVGASINHLYGTAKIVVTDGALLLTNYLFLAQVANSRGTFEQSGGTVSMDGEMYLSLGADCSSRVTLSGGTFRVGGVTCLGRGARSVFELTLTNNASMTTVGEVRGAESAGTTGTITIAGGYLNASNSNFGVGHYGAATLNMTGGRLDCSTLWVGRFTAATGTVNLSGGIIKAGTVIRSSAATGAFNFTGGTLAVDTYDGIMGPLVNAGGTVSPGHVGIGVTHVVSHYTETSTQSVINIQLGGTTQGTQYDWLNVDAAVVTLMGNLRLSFANGFADTIKSSDKFYIVVAGTTIAGAFNNVASGSRLKADGGGSFIVWYGSSSGSESHSKVTLTDYRCEGTIICIR